MKNPQDSDARSVSENFRAERAERSLADATRRQARAVETLDARWRALPPPETPLGALFVGYQPCPRPVVLSVSLPHLAVGARRLVDAPVNVVLRRDTRLALLGDNGAGKSTLLRTLFAACDTRERVLFLPQELSADEGTHCLDEVRSLPQVARGRVLQCLDALGVDPERLLRSRAPSPGEARKLWLARALVGTAWLLLLDEPTHHLDLPSVERLEAALAGWPGALVMCSHDLDFVRAVRAEPVTLPHSFLPRSARSADGAQGIGS